MRNALLIFALMLIASAGAVLARPDNSISDSRGMTALEAMIPRQIGDWYDEPNWMTQVVDPVQEEAIKDLYDQTLVRTYANADGYRIMLSIAYKAKNTLSEGRVHRPEICYPADGFEVHRLIQSELATPFGSIPIRRMLADKGQRTEPVTYWITVGDKAVTDAIDVKLAELSYMIKRIVPDGLVFRVSSIDYDQERANRLQDEFVIELLSSVPPQTRNQLGGFAND